MGPMDTHSPSNPETVPDERLGPQAHFQERVSPMLSSLARILGRQAAFEQMESAQKHTPTKSSQQGFSK